MPTYDYRCKECGKVFEVFRRFSELHGKVNCPNCGSEKAQRVFSVPHIERKRVAGFNFITELLQNRSGIERRMNKESGLS